MDARHLIIKNIPKLILCLIDSVHSDTHTQKHKYTYACVVLYARINIKGYKIKFTVFKLNKEQRVPQYLRRTTAAEKNLTGAAFLNKRMCGIFIFKSPEKMNVSLHW